MKLFIESSVRLIFTVFITCSIVFFAIRLLPGNTAQRLSGTSGVVPSVDAREIPYEDTSLLRAYFFWIGSLLRLDFPPTIYANRDVGALVLPGVLYSCMLVGIGFCASVLLCCILLFVPRAGRIFTVIFLAPPRYIIALSLSIILSDLLGLLPVWSTNAVLQSIIPLTTIILVGTALLFQYIDQRVSIEYEKAYIRTAQAFGTGKILLYSRHILSGILPGVILYSGSILSILFGSSAILERMFGVVGIGNILINAILIKDFPLIQASATILIGIIVVLLNASLYFSKLLIQARHQ